MTTLSHDHVKTWSLAPVQRIEVSAVGLQHKSESFEIEIVGLAVLSRRDLAQGFEHLRVRVDRGVRLLEPDAALVPIGANLRFITGDGATSRNVVRFHVITFRGDCVVTW
ncbi:hypothetical protein ASF24_06185 [Methylobacterium sp. Leaf86]|nr:hypothetical protein ASF24_06185 [Methylobacterium sp. Leaf86]